MFLQFQNDNLSFCCSVSNLQKICKPGFLDLTKCKRFTKKGSGRPYKGRDKILKRKGPFAFPTGHFWSLARFFVGSLVRNGLIFPSQFFYHFHDNDSS